MSLSMARPSTWWNIGVWRLVVIGAVNAARRDNANGRALLFHRPDLHRAGTGAQHMWRAIITIGAVHVERVHLGPCGVVAGDVQRVEIVPVTVDLRTFGNRKAHIGKNRRDLFGDLADRVDRALSAAPTGQCDVKPFAAQPFIKC